MTDTPEPASPTSPRKPSRPKGYPRSGGRQKGTANHLPEELRRYIHQSGRPLDLLAAVALGRKVTAADPEDPARKIRVYPSLSDRLSASRALANKLLPDLKAAELSGPGGAPIEIHADGDGEISMPELARRLAFILTHPKVEEAGRNTTTLNPTPTVSAAASPPDVAPWPEVLAPEQPGYPSGHRENLANGVVLSVEERIGTRERWAARDANGHYLAGAFSRDALLASLSAKESIRCAIPQNRPAPLSEQDTLRVAQDRLEAVCRYLLPSRGGGTRVIASIAARRCVAA